METDAEQKQWEQVDAYLKGELDGEQLADFERRIRGDAHLADAVDRLRLNRSIIRNYGLRSAVKSIHVQAVTRRRVLPLWKYTARIAAGIAVVLVGTVGFRLATATGEGLVDAPHNLYATETTRGGNDEGSLASQRIQETYQRGDYRACTAIYETNPLGAQSQTSDALLAGNAYLAQDLPARAEGCFRRILSDNAGQPAESRQFGEEAEYYLALALLEQNKVTEAEPIFTRIRAQSDHRYHREVGWWFYQQLRWLKTVE